MRSPLRLTVALTLVASASLAAAGAAVAAPSQAGDEGADSLAVTSDATGNPDQAVFDYSINNFTCDSSTVTVDGVDATITQIDPNTGSIALPVGTPGGVYTATFDCDTGKDVESGSLTLTIAAVTVTKVVSGDVPADATFPVTVTCGGGVGLVAQGDSFGPEGAGFLIDTSFSFGPTGGSKYLVAYTPQGCTITETDDGGALSATIDLDNCDDDGGGGGRNAAAVEAAGPSGTFDIVDPTDCTQTIANVFAAPAAQPAVAVQQQPGFTG